MKQDEDDRIESITNQNYAQKSALPLQFLSNSSISFKNHQVSIDLGEFSHHENSYSLQETPPVAVAANGAFIKKSSQFSQSRKLPYSIMYFIMLITGIQNTREEMNETRKTRILLRKFTKFNAIISTVFYMLTVCTGIAFAVTNIWYLVSDSLNTATKTTIFTRSVSIILAMIWFSLGNYAINVLHNLYITKDLQDAIRLKTKSYFKIPASLILMVLIAIFLYAIYANMSLNDASCAKIQTPVMICNLKFYFTIIYSLITLFWNYLVALTIMSITRTNTIDIRRFLMDLETDSFNVMKISASINQKAIDIEASVEFGAEIHEDLDVDYDDEEANTVRKANMKRKATLKDDCGACLSRFSTKHLHPGLKSSSCGHIKSSNNILTEYWKIAANLKLVSSLTQRWMFSLITSILMWCLSCLIDWIDNRNPSLTSVLQFILPLILLAVIFGTFAEANAEGNKIAQVIHPLEERIWLLNYLKQNPLQIKIYGFALDYAAEVKFIGAIAIGFLSQIIFHEMNA